MKFGYSTLAAPKWTVEQCVAAAVEHGYDGVEWRLADGELLSADTSPDVVRRIRDLSTAERIAPVCIDTSVAFVHEDQAGRDRAVAHAIKMTEMAADVGAPLIRVYGGKIPGNAAWQTAVGPAAEALSRVCTQGERIGVSVVVETHDDWCLGAAAAELARASGALVLWDVLHPIRHGETPAATMRMLQGAVGLVHVKDARQDGENWMHVGPGKGRLPLDTVAALLREAGYDGFVCAEIEKHWHPELPEPEDAVPAAIKVLRDKFTVEWGGAG